MAKNTSADIPLWGTLVALISLIAALGFGIISLGLDPHMPILFGTIVAAVIALAFGMEWDEIEDSIVNGIKLAMGAILILLVVGLVIGSWIISGVVPAMVYYGLEIMSPTFFLVSSLIICSIISLAIGSSWTTAGTVGVALIAIAGPLGVSEAMAAGAIVSGAYFGDKLSPLSDTTNLAPAVSGTTLFAHIRHMLWTTIPAYIITAVIFTVIGFVVVDSSSVDLGAITSLQAEIKDFWNISILLLLIPVVVIGLAVAKVPALPALFIGIVLAVIVALTYQGAALGDTISTLHYGFGFGEGSGASAELSDLFERGGLDSMLWTISLIIIAMSFGGIMEGSGMLQNLVDKVADVVKGAGSAVTATVLSCLGLNILGGDQYMAIVLPGRMYRQTYEDLDLHPKNLSRTLEDSGTLTSALIPWNTCGATMYGFLGVSAFTYAPFAIFNWLVPIIAIVLAFVGKFGIASMSDDVESIVAATE